MNISSVPPAAPVPDATAQLQTPQQTADRVKLVQAVRAVNASNTLGEKNELTFVLDRATRRTLVRVIDRETQEVVMQIPAEYVVRLAEQLNSGTSSQE
jgi:flagellar protein FlaG